MTALHGTADLHRRVDRVSAADPRTRRATARHFQAVLAAEVRRLALEQRAAQRPAGG